MAMTDIVLPQVNARGIFVLKAPYDSYIDPNIIYECKEVRKFDELVNNKVDIYKKYYLQSIDIAVYKQHLKEGASIVTLRTDSGKLKYVPSPYIKSFPLGTGVAYRNIILGIRCGALPDDFDLVTVKNKVTEVIQETIGVKSDCLTMSASDINILTFADHDVLTAARQALITNGSSAISMYESTRTELTEANNRIQLLEAALIDMKAELDALKNP